MRSIVSSLSSKAMNRIGSVRTMALAVNYAEHGSPFKVYKLVNIDEPKTPLPANEVTLKFLASPINPSDINLAEGTYGKKPTLPAFGGNEGVAVVQAIGSGVKHIKVGDWVLPDKAASGTWRQIARYNADELVRVPNDVPVSYAASLAVNPASGYRMLRDYVNLKPGDWIIQNGANSMVGLSVIQMAKEMGVHTINICRTDTPGLDAQMRMLSNLGGDIVLPASHLSTASFKEIVSQLPGEIKLGLNCVGGEVATDMVRLMGQGSTLVTFGGMSKKPMAMPFDLLAYKQINLRGFWMTRWTESHTIAEKEAMYADICKLIREDKLTYFYELHDFDDFAYALAQSQEQFRLRKVMLNLDFPDRLAEHDARPESDYEIFHDLPTR